MEARYIKCFKCNEYDKETCARCRDVLKIDLVLQVLGLDPVDPVYLSEGNRNKKGRHVKLTAELQHRIEMAYKKTKSMKRLAKRYRVSKSTVFNAVHWYERFLKGKRPPGSLPKA